jgi:hypothetical protein
MSSFAEIGRELFLTFGSPLPTIESFRLPNKRLQLAALPAARLWSAVAVAARQFYRHRWLLRYDAFWPI